jgi:hypothetical protein
MTWILLLVYLFNFSLLVSGIMLFQFRSGTSWLLVLLGTKAAAELLFLLPVAGFYKNRQKLLVFPFLQPLHILYIVIAGFLSMRGKYSWKGRSIHQH